MVSGTISGISTVLGELGGDALGLAWGLEMWGAFQESLVEGIDT